MRFRNYDDLRCFLVVARHLNMSAAAKELNVTKGAVSYRIQQLESGLGFPVFSRIGRKLELSLQGLSLLKVAQPAFDSMEREIAVLNQGDSSRITIGMATYFASRWLSPRLMNFITAHPDVSLRIQPLIEVTDLESKGLDLAVRWGEGNWEDKSSHSELIFRCPAVLTTSYQIGRQIESEGIDSVLRTQPLLHDRDDSRAWQDWFAAAGKEWTQGPDALVIPDPNVRVQAVIDGQGIALYDFLVQDEVDSRRLYQYKQVQLNEYGYHLVYRDRRESNPAVSTFRKWILEEGAGYRQNR